MGKNLKTEEILYPILKQLKKPYYRKEGKIYIHPEDLVHFLKDSLFFVYPLRKGIGFYQGQKIRIQDDICQMLLPLVKKEELT